VNVLKFVATKCRPSPGLAECRLCPTRTGFNCRFNGWLSLVGFAAQPEAEAEQGQSDTSGGYGMALKFLRGFFVEFGAASPQGGVPSWMPKIQSAIADQDHAEEFCQS